METGVPSGKTQHRLLGLVYVEETDEKAIAKAKRYFTHCFTKVFGTRADGGIGYLRLAENFAKRGDPGGAEIAKNATNLDYLLDRNLAFVGSPRTVIGRIKAAASEGLFNTVLGEFNIGDIAEEDLMRSIKLFGTRSCPRCAPSSRINNECMKSWRLGFRLGQVGSKKLSAIKRFDKTGSL